MSNICIQCVHEWDRFFHEDNITIHNIQISYTESYECHDSTREVQKKDAFPPYSEGVTERMGEVLRKHTVKSVFKSHSKIYHLPSPKDGLNPSKNDPVFLTSVVRSILVKQAVR